MPGFEIAKLIDKHWNGIMILENIDNRFDTYPTADNVYCMPMINTYFKFSQNSLWHSPFSVDTYIECNICHSRWWHRFTGICGGKIFNFLKPMRVVVKKLFWRKMPDSRSGAKGRTILGRMGKRYKNKF